MSTDIPTQEELLTELQDPSAPTPSPPPAPEGPSYDDLMAVLKGPDRVVPAAVLGQPAEPTAVNTAPASPAPEPAPAERAPITFDELMAAAEPKTPEPSTPPAPEDPMSAEEARELISEIRTGWAELSQKVTELYQGRAWIELGYGSWDDLCKEEFNDIRLPRQALASVIPELRAEGMSTRAIASATGVSQRTVGRTLSGQVRQSASPETEVTLSSPGEPEQRVTGVDGKSYAARPASVFTPLPATQDLDVIDAEVIEETPTGSSSVESFVAPPADLSPSAVSRTKATLAEKIEEIAAIWDDLNSELKDARLTSGKERLRLALAVEVRARSACAKALERHLAK